LTDEERTELEGLARSTRTEHRTRLKARIVLMAAEGAATRAIGPRRDMWLKRHKNVHFHFTPTHASWLNQVEIWFSILSGKSLNGASFQSVPELIAHIEAFIASYNETARPFVWTKSEVHQKRLKPCFEEQ
jgi:transposase